MIVRLSPRPPQGRRERLDTTRRPDPHGVSIRYPSGVAKHESGIWRAGLAYLALALFAPTPSAGELDALEPGEPIPLAAWNEPPREARPVARWWWPGGSVEPAVLEDQLRQIRAAGFGAVELQPLLLGIGEDELAADARLRTVGDAGFRESVAAAAALAAQHDLEFDFTLGSGWPGGLPTGKAHAERQLVMGVLDIEGPQRFTGPLPPAPDQSYRGAVEWVLDVLGPQDPETRVVAVLMGKLGAERQGIPVLDDMRVLATADPGRKIDWEVPDGNWRIFALYENSTEHFVMGGAFPGEEADARVVDHLSVAGADALLEGYAAPVVGAVAPGGVREVFVDSFELMGELPSTPDFLRAFREIAGYDLTPHLPLVFRRGGESKYGEMMDLFGRTGGPLYDSADPLRAVRIREDYETVRQRLFEERFVQRFVDWAHARGLALRLQAHGGYGDYLDTYARADVPESEALFAGGSFDFLKLAASAAHVANRRWASSESFITLRLFGTHLSREEMRLLAGRAYSAGINRLAFHGVPYPYARADGKDWYPFSGGFGRILAGPLPMSSQLGSEELRELPGFNRFLARLSVAMSHGEPMADVAWLRAEPIFPDEASLQLGRIEPHAGESEVTRALRARGLVHDRVSRRMLSGARAQERGFQIGARHYDALLLDPLHVAEPELVEKIAMLAESGAPVVTLGALPVRAPGLRDSENRDVRVLAARQRLFARAIPVTDAVSLEQALARHVRSTLVEPLAGERLSVSLERRRSPAGDLLLVFNESWSPETAKLRFTRAGGPLVAWDPHTGERSTLRPAVAAGDVLSLDLGVAETRLWTLGGAAKIAVDLGDSRGSR